MDKFEGLWVPVKAEKKWTWMKKPGRCKHFSFMSDCLRSSIHCVDCIYAGINSVARKKYYYHLFMSPKKNTAICVPAEFQKLSVPQDIIESNKNESWEWMLEPYEKCPYASSCSRGSFACIDCILSVSHSTSRALFYEEVLCKEAPEQTKVQPKRDSKGRFMKAEKVSAHTTYKGLVIPVPPQESWKWMADDESYCPHDSYTGHCKEIQCKTCLYSYDNRLYRKEYYEQLFGDRKKPVNPTVVKLYIHNDTGWYCIPCTSAITPKVHSPGTTAVFTVYMPSFGPAALSWCYERSTYGGPVILALNSLKNAIKYDRLQVHRHPENKTIVLEAFHG